MTVLNETNSVQYTAAGTSGEAFPTVFRFFDDSDIQVLLAGVVQTLGTNYTISGGEGLAGTVNWTGAPTAAATVDIIRRRPATQTHDYIENDSFPSEAHEDTVDKLAMAVAARLGLSTTDARHWDAGSRKILNLSTPTAATDAVTKAYADGLTTIGADLPNIVDPDDDLKFLRAFGGGSAWVFPPFADTDLPSADDGTNSRVLTATGDGTFDWQNTGAGVTTPYNFVINPYGQIHQRFSNGTMDDGTVHTGMVHVNEDGRYVWDRWCLQGNGDDTVDLSVETTVIPPGSPASMKFDVETALRKFGIMQFFTEADTIRMLQGGITTELTLQFKARTPSANPIANIRYAILAWTGVVNDCTRIAVGTWENAGTNPTMAAGYTYEGTPGSSAVTQDAWGTHTLTVTMTLAASTNNIAIFIWVDDTDAALSDLLYISDVMLEIGDAASGFNPSRRTFQVEQALCEQFYWSSFQTLGGVQPVIESSSVATINTIFAVADSGGEWVIGAQFRTAMWRDPDEGRSALLNPGGGTTGRAWNFSGSGSDAVAGGLAVENQAIAANADGAADASDIIGAAFYVENEIGY